MINSIFLWNLFKHQINFPLYSDIIIFTIYIFFILKNNKSCDDSIIINIEKKSTEKNYENEEKSEEEIVHNIKTIILYVTARTMYMQKSIL